MTNTITKTCRSCKVAKAHSEFYLSKGSVGTNCKSCDKLRLKKRADEISASTKIVPLEKVCPRCKENLPAGEFGKNKSRVDSLAFWCKACSREQFAEYRANNPEYAEKNRKRCREVYADRPRQLGYFYWHNYKITLDGYNALLASQGGKCAICRQPPTTQRLSVDHDHACCPERKKSCGKCIRGLLCSGCNFGIGHLQDDPSTLRAAADYLTK